MDFYLVFAFAFLCQTIFAAPKGTRTAQGQGDFLCSPCQSGYGVIIQCSQSEDTICAPCTKGFHSDSVSTLEPCHPCSLCGENLYELHSCNATNDVFCETCAWPVDSQHNADFLRKCVSNEVSGNEYKKNSFGVYEKSFHLPNDAPAEQAGSQGDSNVADPDNNKLAHQDGDKGGEDKVDTTSLEKGDIKEEGSGDVGVEQGVAHLPGDPVVMGTGPGEQLMAGDGSGEETDIYEPIEDFTVKVEVPKASSTRPRDDKFPLKGGVPVYSKAVTPAKSSTIASTVAPEASDPPIEVFGEVPYIGEKKDPELGASKSGSVGAFPILMAILTAGVIFFAVGFFYNRFKGGSNKQVFTPQQMRMKPVYKQTATEPPADDEDYKPPVKRVPTPEIIYTTHDEPDVQNAPVPDVVLPPPPSTANKPDLRKPMPPIGKYQSPVDIDPEEAELSDDLEKSHLVFNYVPENTKSLTNLGNTVKVMVDCRGSDLHGGPLGDKRYCLDHFRFHWGADDTRGSEHSVAGKRYAGEIQLVHWNKEDFRTFAEASRYESGLSILSIFMEVSGDQHTNLQVLLDVFKSIQYKGGSVEVPHHYFDPAVLLPGNTLEYWTYPGSLTESPYHETVTWLVMKEPIQVSSAQMATFRTLMRTEKDEGHGVVGEQLVDNFREQAALGDRSLRASFR